MTFRKSSLILIALSMVAALVGCSSSSKPITVTLSSVGTSLAVNSQTPITATVANDSKAGGVKWACTPAATCGSFSATTTASGVATTYTAPGIITSNVVITATSVDNTAITASTSAITISGATLTPNSSYVYSLSGDDVNSLYSVSGVFTVGADGTTITGGEQDYVDFSVPGNHDLINGTGSSVSVTADGNLQITLVTCLIEDCTQADTTVGVAGTETFNGTVTPMNPNKALITEFDASATSSGELNLQDAVAAAATPSGGYAFSLSGLDSQEYAVSLGGVINVDGAGGTISGAHSVYDMNDSFLTGLYPQQPFSASTVSSPDAMGRVVFTLNNPTFGSFVLIGYIVDSNKIRLVENYLDGFGGTTGGTARSQGANTETFTPTSVAGQTYVVGLLGLDGCGPLQVAAQLTLNADNTVAGFVNYNDFCNGVVNVYPTTASALVVGGTWLQDAITGRVSVSNLSDDSSNFQPFDVQLYPDGNGTVMSISMDTFDAMGGRGVMQTTGQGTGAGPFAMNLTGWDYGAGQELDAVGPIVSDGSASFSGLTDLTWFGTLAAGPTYPGNPTTGAFAVDANGVDYDGTILGVDVDNCSVYGVAANPCPTPGDVFVFYVFDPNGENVAIETDTNQLTLGYFIQQ